MSPAILPIFVLVPGILHTPAHFEPLKATLQSKGYECVSLALPNIGSGAPHAAPHDDAKAVRDALEELVVSAGRDVVLVCHSYGGVPGCQAVSGLEKVVRREQGHSGGIVQLIFLNAFIVEEGKSALDALIKIGQPPPPWIEPDPSNDAIHKPNDLAGQYLFNDLDEPARSEWAARLLPISANHQTTPIKSSCWKSDIPKCYVSSHDDRALWPSTQRAMLEQVQNETWSTLEIASGHAPFLSQPKELTELLIARAQEALGDGDFHQDAETAAGC